ncbi:MAG: thiol peroxidase [SAR324 cluster bacterium]|nr:thiol peroxidase [SAR324 cluster bacterium]
MAEISWRGLIVNTEGEMPQIGSKAPDFMLAAKDLSDLQLIDFAGKNLILNIFPSIDTPTCATSVRTFNVRVADQSNTVVLCVSVDLPQAQARFCGAENIENVQTGSAFRSPDFGKDYGVIIKDSFRRGLMARAIVVINGNGIVKHTELVPEVAQQPDYDAALAAAS